MFACQVAHVPDQTAVQQHFDPPVASISNHPRVRVWHHHAAAELADHAGLSAEAVLDMLQSLSDADEGSIQAAYVFMQLLPGPCLYPGKIKMGGNVPFDRAALPEAAAAVAAGAPPLATPRPDQHYCLDHANFVVGGGAGADADGGGGGERRWQPVQLQPQPVFATPSSAGCWPFFTVEFKSEARGGTFWVAENQSATSGAVCVNAMEKLLAMVAPTTTIAVADFDSVSFSCNVNASTADLWIHYCPYWDRDRDRCFCSSRLRRFDMGLVSDVVAFRNAVRNIVEFGFKDRLPRILEVLARIADQSRSHSSQEVKLVSDDKRRRVRKADDEGEALGAPKKTKPRCDDAK